MPEYVFKEEFLEENRPKILDESINTSTKQPKYFENSVKLIFIKSAVCFLIVLLAFIVSAIAPKTYNGFKKAYVSATTESDIKFEDIKKLLSAAYDFIFTTNGNKQYNDQVLTSQIPIDENEKLGSGGDVSGKNVSLNAYLLTSQIAAPTKGTVTSLFGSRIHPIFKTESFHTGLDIAAKAGTNITAAFSGTVYECGKSEAYGNYIIMRHSPSLYTFYGHCQSLKAKEGMKIRKGEVIAFMGSTGYSTGPHLHFEIRIDGKSVNPAYVLKGNPNIEF